MTQATLAKVIADFETSLAAKMAIGATTATLISATDDDSVALPAGRYFFTIDGDNSSKEHISCTLSGTALSAIKTVSRQGTETSGVLRAHRVGAKVVITDWAHIRKINDLLDGTTNFDGSVPLGYSTTTSITTDNQFATKLYVDGVAIAGAAKATEATYGITRLTLAPAVALTPIAVGDNDTRVPTQGENDALVGTSGTPSSSNKYVTNDDTTGTGSVVRASVTSAIQKFGGTGADGALTVTSGVTTIDLGSSAYVVKNYTSISITGTGSIAFSNPHASGTVVELKSQGDVTLTSSTAPMINASGIGAASGTSQASAASSGSNGTTSNYIFSSDSSNGKLGTGGSRTGGAGGVVYTTKNIYGITQPHIYRKWGLWLTPGSGGGSGGTGGAGTPGASGAGGRGGGALYIECRGAWNFTTALGISVKGANGSAAAAGSGNSCGSGGGGGGAGGMCVVLYNTLTANSGTINVTGGNGGNGANGTGSGLNSYAGDGGGGAGMFAGAGGAGGLGGLDNNDGAGGSAGTNSVSSGAGGGTGGTGGTAAASDVSGGGGGGGGCAGEYLVTINSEIA